MEDERLLRLIGVQACWLGFLPWKSPVKISSTGFPLLKAVCQEFFHLSIALFIMVLLWFSAVSELMITIADLIKKNPQEPTAPHEISGSNLINLVFELRYAARRISFCMLTGMFLLKRHSIRNGLSALRQLCTYVTLFVAKNEKPNGFVTLISISWSSRYLKLSFHW